MKEDETQMNRKAFSKRKEEKDNRYEEEGEWKEW